ncbi:hypothetical protein [Streptomyces sp. TE5632]
MGGAKAARVVEWVVKQERCFSEASDTTRCRFLTSFLATRTPSPDGTFVSGSCEMRPDGLGEVLFRKGPDGGAPEPEEERHTAFNAFVQQYCGTSATTSRKRAGEMR